MVALTWHSDAVARPLSDTHTDKVSFPSLPLLSLFPLLRSTCPVSGRDIPQYFRLTANSRSLCHYYHTALLLVSKAEDTGSRSKSDTRPARRKGSALQLSHISVQ